MNELTAPGPSQLKARSQIDRLEAELRRMVEAGATSRLAFGGSEEGDDQCQHAFGDGIYARGLLIPAGEVVVGRLHKQARVCIIAKGKCVFMDENQQREVEAPWMGEFEAGCKTAVYAVTDTFWIACLGTDIKDSRQVFGELTTATHEEYAELA